MSFSDNKAKSRFEYQVDQSTAFANYHVTGETLYIDYVEAPPELRGSGAAGKLMQYVMDTARTQNQKVIPICGYAASWITRHTEYDDLRG